MWIWIAIVGLIFLIFIWGVLAGTRREDDEYQLDAIKKWRDENDS